MHDIAIVGGGPGGLHAAHHLASQGFTVELFEEHASAGDPVHCTGVLAAEAFDEFDVPRQAFLNALTTVRFFSPSGAVIEHTTSRVEAVVIDRREFDRSLWTRAAGAGATLHTSRKVTAVDVTGGGVEVTAGNRIARYRACILACGASYIFQKRLGLGIPALHLQSAQIEIPVDAAGDVEVHFGNAVAPKGFAWAVPVHRDGESYARIGLMCERNAAEYFGRFFADVAERWQAPLPREHRGSVVPRIKLLPLGPISRTYADRVLAIGDAAGLVKATTGGGIFYSLLSGRLAADTLADGLSRNALDAAALARYQTRWQKELADEFDAQMHLRRLSHGFSDDEIDGFFDLARSGGIMPLVRKTARFNKHRDVIVSLLSHPPARRVLMKHVLGWGRTA
jgi:digeranylgeranylglycerophospholipid reductase